MSNKKRWLTRNKQETFLFLLPVLILLISLSIYPVIRGIYLGFTKYKVGRGSGFNGLENYFQIYESGYLIKSFENITFMVAVSVICIYLLSISLSLLLNGRIPLRGLWRTLLIIPWAVPPVAKIAMWKEIFKTMGGELNYYLLQLGIISERVAWRADAKTAIYVVITVFIWGCIPFVTLSFLSTLQQIPKDINEAAIIDGATPLQIFRYVTLPYLNQTTAISMSLVIIWIMNDFATQYGLGGPGTSTLTPMVEAYRQGFRYGNFGYASAYGNMLIVVVSVILFIYIRAMNKRSKGVN